MLRFLNKFLSFQGSKEESMLLIRHCYREDELFLDMFDDEFQNMTVSAEGIKDNEICWFENKIFQDFSGNKTI